MQKDVPKLLISADRSLTLSGATPLPKETRAMLFGGGSLSQREKARFPILDSKPFGIFTLGGGGISCRYATWEGAKKIL